MPHLRILLLEDSPLDTELIKANLHEGGIQGELVRVENREQFLSALSEQEIDLILADYSLPAFDGVAALDLAHQHCPEVPFIFVSATLGEELAIETLKRGATDYVLKQRLGRLVPSIQRALREAKERSERKWAEERLQKQAIHAQILAEISQAFSETIFGCQSVLDTTAQYIADLIGDSCIIRLLSDDGQWLNLAAMHHRNPEARALIETLLTERQPAEEGIYARVFDTGKPVLISTTSPEELQAWLKPNIAPYLEQFGISSFVIAPLCVRGRSVGTLGMFRDRGGDAYTVEDQHFLQSLSDRIALGIDNARLYQASQQANRVKDEFLATLSHELRSPLNAILGWSKLLCSRQFDPETTTRALHTIERNARLQTQLIGDLLDVSRILRGKLNLEVFPVHLGSPIEAAIETMRLAAESKSIQLETTIEPNVPPVLGDPGRLQQVIWNLLSNAIKFTPDGGRIDIRLDTVKTQARIQVKDTGKGISPDFLPYIFEYFRQADSSMTRTQGGLGLGLAIVHHLVELHGGTVSAASPGEGQGATFTVLLPLQKRESYPGEMEGSEAEAASPCSPSSESDLEGLHVIVVDDDPDTREFLSFLLRQHHAEVQAFDAANLAFTAFIESPPDILISDIGMPQEDGYSLIKRIRSLAGEKGGGIPAIALTAYAREEDQQQALAAGFQTHLAKPVNSSELLTTILHLVED